MPHFYFTHAVRCASIATPARACARARVIKNLVETSQRHAESRKTRYIKSSLGVKIYPGHKSEPDRGFASERRTPVAIARFCGFFRAFVYRTYLSTARGYNNRERSHKHLKLRRIMELARKMINGPQVAAYRPVEVYLV